MANDERGRQNSHALISKQEKGDGEEEPNRPNNQPTCGAEGREGRSQVDLCSVNKEGDIIRSPHRHHHHLPSPRLLELEPVHRAPGISEIHIEELSA